MSILIKNMEMPGTGRYLIVYPDGRVVDTDIDGESQCIIPGSKAVPVPPHGRLIDADALMENAQYEKEKMLIDKTIDSKTYEEKIKAIAKKWKI